jgi:adhesin transport system outer membrane protein
MRQLGSIEICTSHNGVFILKLIHIAILTSGLSWGLVAHGQTLEQAVALTLAENPEVKSSFNTYMGALKGHDSAGGAYRPRVDLNAGIGYERNDSDNSDATNLNRKDATLSINQLLWDGASTLNNIDRTAAEAESNRLQLIADAQDKALEVSKVYLAVLQSEEIYELSKSNLDVHKDIYVDIKKRTDSGIGSTADLSQVEARLANANSNLLAAQNNLLDNQAQYLQLVGKLPTDLILPKVDENDLPSSLEAALVLAKNTHPVLQIALADIDAATFQYKQSEATNYPTFSIEASQSWYDDADGTEGRRDETSAMLRMTYNLYNGGSDLDIQEQSAYQLNKAKDLRDLALRSLTESLSLSWNALKLTHQQQQFLSVHVDSASDTANAYDKQYRIGKRTLLDLLNTENELFEARKTYLDAYYSELYAKYRVLNASGILLDSLMVEIPNEWKQVVDY